MSDRPGIIYLAVNQVKPKTDEPILPDDPRTAEELAAYVAFLERRMLKFRNNHPTMPWGWLNPDLPLPSEVPLCDWHDVMTYREREAKVRSLQTLIATKRAMIAVKAVCPRAKMSASAQKREAVKKRNAE